MNTEAEKDVMDSLIGRSLVDWHSGEDGMHFTLDDGRTVIFATVGGGIIVIGVFHPEEMQLH